jgi:hypothetical protein
MEACSRQASQDIITLSCDPFDKATNIKGCHGKDKSLKHFTPLGIIYQDHGINFDVIP